MRVETNVKLRMTELDFCKKKKNKKIKKLAAENGEDVPKVTQK